MTNHNLQGCDEFGFEAALDEVMDRTGERR